MIKLHNTDAIRWALEYDGPPFHALLSDTPYHLTTITKRFGNKESAPPKAALFGRLSSGFMGNTWDGGDIAFNPETWESFMRVLYPGAFGMAFAASRNWHHMAVAIEDAGFIIHPTIFLWCYSSGFPKATNISELLKPNRGVVKCQNGKALSNWAMENLDYETRMKWYRIEKAQDGHRYGLQALKPAVEPIIVFQKPYDGRPLDNIVESGAGALNVDAGRIGSESIPSNRWKDSAHPFGNGAGNDYETVHAKVRWPANFLLGDEESAAHLDHQTGTLKSGHFEDHHVINSEWGYSGGHRDPRPRSATYGDSGGASRFFYNVQHDLDSVDPVYYCAKASGQEKEAGLEGLEERKGSPECRPNDDGTHGISSRLHGATIKGKNPHPTVKPLDLCRYLASLLLPPVMYAPRRLFVPFSGVASECIGGHLAGWDEIHGVEFDTENGYIDIAEKRIKYWTSKPVALDLFTGKGV